MELAIEQAKGSKLLDRFIVSTEDKELYRVASEAKAPVPFLRPENLAQDDSSTYSVIKHAVEWFVSNENWRPDAVVILQPTTPFRKSEYIDAAIKKLMDTSCDAVITVCHPDYPPHWNLSMNEQGNLQCLIEGGTRFTRRQDTPVAYKPNGMVYVLKTDFLYKMKGLLPQGDTRGIPVPESESINIDTWTHYKLCQILWQEKFGN